MGWIQTLFGFAEEPRPAKPTTKAKGFALCIGLNAVDPDFYDGWDGQLNACENDATAMAHYLESRGFNVSKMLTKDAKRESVLAKLRFFAAIASPGDIVVVTNSSHGGQVPDYDNTESDQM